MSEGSIRGSMLRRGSLAVVAALAYYTGARLGYAFAIPHGFVTLWPPAGVMLAMLALTERQSWPGILLGGMVASIASDLRTGYSLPLAAVASIANAGESALAAWVLTHRVGAPVRLTTVRNVVELAIGAAMLANGVSALLGAAMLHVGFHASFWTAWLMWWVGDGLGMLLIAPPILVWADPGERAGLGGPLRWSEALLVVIGLALVSHGVFGPHSWPLRPGPYAILPFMLWAGLRFGPIGATTSALIVATYATWNAGRGSGPFVSGALSTLDTAVQVYAFLLVAVLSALVPAVALAERRIAQEKLRDSEARHRAVVEAATDAIVTVDERSTILFANSAVKQIFGYSSDELIGRDLRALMPERLRGRHRAAMARYVDTGQRTISWQSAPLIGLRKDGQEVPLEVSFGVEATAAGPVFTGVLRDVSARVAAQAALDAAHERARQSQKMEAVGQLAGGVAHDFNNLLTVILSYSTILGDALGDGHPLREDVDEIKLAGERAAAVTRQLLAFSRKEIVAPRVMSLSDSLRSIEPMLRRLIGEDIEIGVDARAAGNISADPNQVEQVILNLALNARDAMPDGGTLLLETLDVPTPSPEGGTGDDVPPGPCVMLLVSDTGVGMKDEMLSHIFEPFFTTKAPGKGTGLGLATVHGIVKQSHGTVRVDSEVGQGTTFRILFPRVDEAMPAPAPATPRATGETGQTILVIEDDTSLRGLTARILQQHGYVTLAAADPHTALEIAARHDGPIHLVLSDVVLPEMSGRALGEQIAASRPETGLLYMSGYTDDVIMRRGVMEHGTRFIHKPFEPAELLRRVREAIEEGRGAD